MPTAPLTPDYTPAKLSTAELFATVKPPDTPLLTAIQPRRTRKAAGISFYECDNTGNDHLNNHLHFSELTELSLELAAIFRHLSLDYIDVPTHHNTDTPIARQLLQRDTKEYCGRIATSSARIQRNTILRALILFSSCSYHATQYLEHSADDRVAWLNQLNTSGVWLKPLWEKDIATRMVGLMEQNLRRISMICEPEIVYGVVHNSYFLMLFARHEYSELSDELRLLDAKPYSWHDLSCLRNEYF